MVSILLVCAAVEWRWCGVVLVHPTQCEWPMSSTPSAHGVSTASCHALLLVRLGGVWVVSVCLWCSCGGVSSVRSPLTVVVGGAIVDGGACGVVVGGIAMEGRVL